MKRIYLIDCPGIVPPSLTDSAEDVLLRGSVRVEGVENCAQYIPAVLARVQRRHLERTYEISLPPSSSTEAGMTEEEERSNMVGGPDSEKSKTAEAIRFLELLARKGGRLLKGGEADLDGVAKMVVGDFLRGRLPWFVPPPASEASGKDDLRAEEGRDEMLGLGKRKRAADDVDGQTEVDAEEKVAAGEEVQEGRDDFGGFSEDDEDDGGSETGQGGVELDEGESEEEEDDEEEDDENAT